MNTFSAYEVVKYDTGTTYMVLEQQGPQSLMVKGWKNGSSFGAIRFIDPTRCELLGKATRLETKEKRYSFKAAGE